MSADGGFLIFLGLFILAACYATARANRIKLQRETNARLAAMQTQLDEISAAVGVGSEPPVDRVLVAERIDQPMGWR